MILENWFLVHDETKSKHNKKKQRQKFSIKYLSLNFEYENLLSTFQCWKLFKFLLFYIF